MPKWQEVAVLVVGGLQFKDWETVWVQHRYAEPFALFRFTSAERENIKRSRWESLRFRPGERCLIQLGGQLAMNGIILTRQVAYDANHHGVQLDGKGGTWWAAKSSIDHKTHNFDGMNFVQIARKVLSPYTVGIKIIGTPDPTPFVKEQAQPGKTIWDYLEGLARPRGIVLGSDHLGNFLIIGPHTMPVTSDLIEGHNILKMQCIITIDPFFQKYSVTGQSAADDSKRGTANSEMFASVMGSAPMYSHRIVPAEQPVWGIEELKARAANEKIWHEQAIIEAHITVPGWLKPSGDLWRTGDVHQVVSPMAPLDMPLAIEVATFTQDRSSGTLTTLKMVRPELLRAGASYVLPEAAPPNIPNFPFLNDTREAEAPPNGPVEEPPAVTPQSPEMQNYLPPGTTITPDGEIVVKGESGGGGGGGGGSGF